MARPRTHLPSALAAPPKCLIETEGALRQSRSVEGAGRLALQVPAARSGLAF